MESYQQAYEKLNKAQKQAVDTTEGPVLVIAGPGTGKTQLLTTRVAHILNTTDVEPSNILCLTFTESAAFEMRTRLINLIGKRAYNITIATYHSFGSDLIRYYPDFFGNIAGSKAVDELGTFQIIKTIQEGLPYSNVLKQAKTKDIIDSISDFKQALIGPSDLKKIIEGNDTFVTNASKFVRTHLSGVVRISKKNISSFEKLAKSTSKLQKNTTTATVVPLSLLWQQQLEESLDQAASENSTKAITKWKNSWLERDSRGEFCASGSLVNRKLDALREIYEQYLEQLKLQGLFDYDDMIIQAIEALKNNPDFRYTLQEKYLYILLDEFQDTNAAQLELVHLLTDNPIYEGKPNVMAVGDDDQAIYAFQGADYSHMEYFKHKMYRDVAVISLTKNYRSTKPILDLSSNIVNQISERLLANKTLKPTITDEKTTIIRHEFKSDVSEYGWITAEISKLVNQGVKPGEIAVLAPRHRHLEPLLPYLQKAKLPVTYEKRENILEDIHINQIIQMSKLVLALNSNNHALADELWPEILSFDFWELPNKNIWELSWKAYESKTHWSKLLSSSTDFNTIAEFFLKLASTVSFETLETMLDYIVGVKPLSVAKNRTFRSKFYTYNFGKDQQNKNISNFWNVLSNLTVLRQKLRDTISTHEQFTLSELIVFVNAHNNAGIKLLNTSPYHQSEESIQLMTPYRAKGMEFEYVFLVSVNDDVWGSSARTQSSQIPLPANLRHIRYIGSDDNEKLRLFYVALTRAKKGLFLTNYQTNFANKPSTRLKLLDETHKNDKLLSPLMPKGSIIKINTSEATPKAEDLGSFWQTRHVDENSLSSLKSLLRPRLDQYQLAPTHLNSFVDVITGGPQHFFINTILRFPKAPTPNGEFGKAIHETIQQIHIQKKQSGRLPNINIVHDIFALQLKQKKISSEQFEQLLVRGLTCLDTFMNQKGNTFNSNNEHEFSFRKQGVFVGNAHITGNIDKLIIDKKERAITIVDFKTGKSYSSWKQEPKLHKYIQQLYIYKLLVEGSYQFADFQVKDAYLQFVEPDLNGHINDLHIQFDQTEMDRLTKLIKVIFTHIQELNFPDISAYPKNLQGIRKFEDDLINCTI